MKTTILIIIAFISITAKIMADRNKKKSKEIDENMNFKKLEILYKTKIGIISTYNDFKKFFEIFNITNHWNCFNERIRNEIRIKTIPTKNILIGKSKIGGLPDLPKGTNWPQENNGKPLSFIAQINFQEIQNFKKDLNFPSNGILYFFYSTEENWNLIAKENKFKTLYFDKEIILQKKNKPKHLDFIFDSCELEFSNSVSLMDSENILVQSRLNRNEREIYKFISYPNVNNKMFGYSNNIQGEMELECELISKEISYEDYTNLSNSRKDEIVSKSSEWLLLLQIDSDNSAKMMWGDSGKIYFWIKKEDLINRKFDNTCLILQCY